MDVGKHMMWGAIVVILLATALNVILTFMALWPLDNIPHKVNPMLGGHPEGIHDKWKDSNVVSAQKLLHPASGERTFRQHPGNRCNLSEVEMLSQLQLHPDQTDTSREHAINIEVLEQGFRILHPGLYHVFVSVLFNTKCQESRVRTVMIILERPGTKDYQENIFARTSDEALPRTEYLGGQVCLQPGDILSLRVSGWDLIDSSKDASFFGLHLLAATKGTAACLIKE